MDKALLGFTVEVIRRSNMAKGFEVLPYRWVIERIFGWMSSGERLRAADQRDRGHNPHY